MPSIFFHWGRAALGLSFLLPASDRLGLYGNPSVRGVSWGTFERFLDYTAKANAFAPAWIGDREVPFKSSCAARPESTTALDG